MPKKKIEYISRPALCPACGGEKRGFYSVCTTCKGQGVIKAEIPKEKIDVKTNKVKHKRK